MVGVWARHDDPDWTELDRDLSAIWSGTRMGEQLPRWNLGEDQGVLPTGRADFEMAGERNATIEVDSRYYLDSRQQCFGFPRFRLQSYKMWCGSWKRSAGLGPCLTSNISLKFLPTYPYQMSNLEDGILGLWMENLPISKVAISLQNRRYWKPLDRFPQFEWNLGNFCIGTFNYGLYVLCTYRNVAIPPSIEA